MDKKLTIYNYLKKPVEIIIPNFENVKAIVVTVITGDEVLTAIYKDNSSKVFDSYNLVRFQSHFDGEVIVSPDQIDIVSSTPDSYDLLAHFGDPKAREAATSAFLDKILKEKF